MLGKCATHIAKMKYWITHFSASILSGCLLFLACAKFDIWPLAWVGFVPLLWIIRQLPPRSAFFWGWITGIAGNAGGFYWITNLLMRFGKIHWLPAFILFLLLCAYQGLHFGLFTYLTRKIKIRAPRLPLVLLAPIIMTSLELLMPLIFPWYFAITQAWVTPIIQVADLTGPLGVTFLLLLVNGLLFDGIDAWFEHRPFPWKTSIAGASIVLFSLGYGGIRIHQMKARWQDAPKVKVGVVQANIGIVENAEANLAAKHMNLHLDQSRKLISQGAELLVWPESAYPYAFDRTMTRDWPPGHPFRVMNGLSVPLLFGTLTYSRNEPYPYNSAYLMEPDGRITGRFDKNYLMVFGEYIPFYEYIPNFKQWFPSASNLAHGHEVTTFPFRNYRLGPLICYEDIIPAFGRRIAELKPNLLINITNDAWFGATSEPYEHLALSVFRAVENRLAMVRAVNTGVSAFIDATGKVYQQTASFDPVVTPGVQPVSILNEAALLSGGETIYAQVGDLFGYLNLAGIIALLFIPRRYFFSDQNLNHQNRKKQKNKSGGTPDSMPCNKNAETSAQAKVFKPQ